MAFETAEFLVSSAPQFGVLALVHVDLQSHAACEARAAKWLSSVERARSIRYHLDRPLREFILCRAALRMLCAGQRPDQVGSNPTGARVRGAISKGGGNASLAGLYRYAIV